MPREVSRRFWRAVKELRRRRQAICDYYDVPILYATGMSLEEIEWFEEKIKKEKESRDDNPKHQ